MKDVEVSDDALEDLKNGYLFYEAQELGFGEFFAACLRGDIEFRLEFTAWFTATIIVC